MNITHKNQIYNLFMAGWCADAVGARLEFQSRRFTDEEVNAAMHFSGLNSGGVFPGQFTDDSELEIALMQGLLNGKNEPYFPVYHIAQQYIDWVKSEPFDIGQTTIMALSGATDADDMTNNAYKYNRQSESNGSLMRCVPTAVASLHRTNEQIMELAGIESSLTHSSEVACLVTGVYCCILSQILRCVCSGIQPGIEGIIYDVRALTLSNAKVTAWFEEALALNDLSEYNALNMVGHVKHAFTFVIYFLKNIDKFTYEEAVREVLKCGGDTDTNAKIVGNLMGAYHANCVPDHMMNPVLAFNCAKDAKGPYRRPKHYGIRHALDLVAKMCEWIQ